MRILFLVLFLIGCNQIQLGDSFDKARNWNKYHIVKNKSTNKIWSSTSSLTFQADLSQAIYNNHSLGLDSLDWNKLYGITSSKIHENSYRIGFRRYGNKWQYAAYWYVKGNVGYQQIGECKLYDRPEFIINLKDNHCYFEMIGFEPLIVDAYKPKHLYRSFPHFGGNQKAPQSLDIWIREKRTI